MRPELFRVFDVAFPAYFGLLLTGFLFATAVGALWARRIGQNPDSVVDLGLTCLIWGVVGGRLLHVFADGYFWDYVHLCTDPQAVTWPYDQAMCAARHGAWDAAASACHPAAQNCFAWAEFWAGGLTYYGGFIGASAAAVYLLKRDRFPFWKAADMAGFAVPLGLAFGRMGCLLAGCCFGLESGSSLALAFPPNSPASDSQFKLHELASPGTWSHPVLPTQIFESAMCLAIAAACLFYVHPRKRYDGQVFVTFLVAYAGGRFLLEYVRADDRGGLLGLSTSQLIGLAVVAVAVVIHVARTRRPTAPPPSAVAA
ncbi:MAG TPA: prolipoprotein diacylglyceryl transferase family protein [Byssovorax sp.]|jgi:phosphatidylglycerol:prolipoprotein diacylglycerol transferase